MSERLNCAYFGKIHLIHQPVHSPCTDVYAIITLKKNPHFIRAETLIGLCIYFKNTFAYMLIFFISAADLMLQIFVICASVDL